MVWNPLEDGGDALPLSFTIDMDKDCSIITHTVDEKTCNPLKIWHDLGEPRSLTDAQAELLRNAAKPLVSSSRLTSENGNISFDLTAEQNSVIYFEITPSTLTPDRGYKCPSI